MSAEKIVVGDKVYDVRELRKFFPADCVEGNVAKEIAEAFAAELGLNGLDAHRVACLACNLVVIAWERGLADGINLAAKGGAK